MSTMIFVDVLAYAAIGLVAIAMIVFGITMMRSSTASRGLEVFLGPTKAREVMTQGAFDQKKARAIGGLSIFFAVFLFIAIARGIAAN